MRTVLLTALLVAPLALSAQSNEPAVRLSLNENGEYESGDNARVRVRTAQDGYLVVLRTEVDGWIRVLYPTDPFHDHFVRGGDEFEVRGRGDREAFKASWRSGSGVVLAAYSTQPFDFTGFSLNDHWDYRVLDTLKSASDPEAALLAIVDQMADSGSVEYDVMTYTVGDNRATRYTSTYYYSSWSPYYSSHYYYWYRPYYSSYYDYYWYRPYYRSYYSCYFCINFGYGYRPWGYRSYYSYGYYGYGYYGRPWRPYYSSWAYGYSYRSWNRYAFNDWNRGGWTAGRELRNSRTGEIAERSRYTADLADRRRREVTVTTPTVQTAAMRRTVTMPSQTGTAQTATAMRRVISQGGTASAGTVTRRTTSEVGTASAGTVMRRVTSEGGGAGVARREFTPGDRSVTVRRDATTGESRTIRRVEVPGRSTAESRGFSGGERTYSRPVYDGGGGGGGRSVSRGSPDGGRVAPSRDGGYSRPSSGGYSRPSSGGGVSDGGGRRSPGGYSAPSGGSSGGGARSAPSRGSSGGGGGGERSAPSRGSSGGGGERSAPSSGGEGRRRG